MSKVFVEGDEFNVASPCPHGVINIFGKGWYETEIKEETIYIRPKWISVKERKPEPYDFVLVFADNQGSGEPKAISIARLIGNNCDTWDFIGESNMGVYQDIEYHMEGEDITHWTPLPEFPQ